MRIPSWLGAAGPLHSEAVYIGADRFRYRTDFACNQATDHTYTSVLSALSLRASEFATNLELRYITHEPKQC